MTEEKTPTPPTPAPAKVEEDLEERIKGFNAEIIPLLGKYELGLAAVAKILPDGRISADPVIVTVRGKKPAEVKDQTKPEEKITNPDKS